MDYKEEEEDTTHSLSSSTLYSNTFFPGGISFDLEMIHSNDGHTWPEGKKRRQGNQNGEEVKGINRWMGMKKLRDNTRLMKCITTREK